MAIDLRDKVNITTAAPYTLGQIKDNTGSGGGTPVNVNTYGDFHQFFAYLMNQGGIVYSGIMDNPTTNQLFQALQNVISSTIRFFLDALPANETRIGGLEVGTQAETDAGSVDNKIVTPLKLAANLNTLILGTWGNDTTTGNITPSAGTISSQTVDVSYRKMGKTLFVNFSFTFKIGTANAPHVTYSTAIAGINRTGKKVITKPLSIFRSPDHTGATSGVSHGYMTVDAINGLQMTMYYDTDVSNSGGTPDPFFQDSTAMYSVAGEFVVEIV